MTEIHETTYGASSSNLSDSPVRFPMRMSRSAPAQLSSAVDDPDEACWSPQDRRDDLLSTPTCAGALSGGARRLVSLSLDTPSSTSSSMSMNRLPTPGTPPPDR